MMRCKQAAARTFFVLLPRRVLAISYAEACLKTEQRLSAARCLPQQEQRAALSAIATSRWISGKFSALYPVL